MWLHYGLRKWVNQPDNEFLGEIKTYAFYITMGLGLYCGAGIGADWAVEGNHKLAIEYLSQNNVCAFMAAVVGYTALSAFTTTAFNKKQMVYGSPQGESVIQNPVILPEPALEEILVTQSEPSLETLVIAVPHTPQDQYQTAA